ncbi:PQQ-binding-like beta-propeller repeat protein [Nocardiopsis algeriensis]|uniref:outer membrane protein assembly factor BamB family protein n=1 Tax=Nocardiopsis algeriensis TaxID=1478215 RepID=UPI003B43D59A
MCSSRVPGALACGLVALLVAGCTGDPEPPAPPAGTPEEPAPVPTSFEGDPPPGIEGEVLRYLHGDSADVHEIFADPGGVRISAVGDAFLVSAGSEDRHLLHDAATGETLWEGGVRLRGFDADLEREAVMLMEDAEGTSFALDGQGGVLWEETREGDVFLDGIAVRRPAEWTHDDPYGEYVLLDAGGEELWSYEFAAPEEEGDEEDEAEEDGEEDDGSQEEPALGVPVAAWQDLVLLASGGPELHARSLDPDSAGEELWTVDGEDEDLGLVSSGPVPTPQVLGFHPLPDEGGDVLLVRWASSEAASVLSAHDPDDGELLWTLEEPGTNPVAHPYDPAGTGGALYDGETGTLLLPQASGTATAVALDLAEGETLWGLEEEGGAFSPAFAFDGMFYGTSRGGGDQPDTQVVLDARSMDTVSGELSSQVEAVTDSGHAVLVQGRQRFVYGPSPEEAEASESPSPEPSE